MGLFSKALGGGTSNFVWTTQHAVMVVVISAICADGSVSDVEVGRLRSMLARSPIYCDNSTAEDDRLIDFALDQQRQNGDRALAEAAAALDQPLRETAFAFACEMLFADGSIGPDEEQFIDKLCSVLAIDANVADAVALATVIRMRS
jgi:tellurite resistance protein